VAIMSVTKNFLLAAGVLAVTIPAGAGTASWIHVSVDEGGAKANTVRVNLPLAVVDAATPLVKDELAKAAKHGAGEAGLDKARLIEMWKAVKNAGDAEFVTVRDGDEHVRVAKIGGKLVVKVEDAGKENVSVEIPGEVVDALLSGPGDELDVAAAIEVLKRQGHGTLVTVDDKDSKVRVWIDDKNVSE
jgi:hypothetical protein